MPTSHQIPETNLLFSSNLYSKVYYCIVSYPPFRSFRIPCPFLFWTSSPCSEAKVSWYFFPALFPAWHCTCHTPPISISISNIYFSFLHAFHFHLPAWALAHATPLDRALNMFITRCEGVSPAPGTHTCPSQERRKKSIFRSTRTVHLWQNNITE